VHAGWRPERDERTQARTHALDALGQARPQGQLELVHGDVVEHAVGARQVDVLKDAGGQAGGEELRSAAIGFGLRVCVVCVFLCVLCARTSAHA